jgi:hypothetical protein
MKAAVVTIVFALGVTAGVVAPMLIGTPAFASDTPKQHETYNLEWEKLARDPQFRKAIAVVVNEACIVNNSMIYCD